MSTLSRWIARALDAGCAAPPAPAHVVVVLAGGLRPDGGPSRSTAQRVRAAARLWHQGIAPFLLMSGGRRAAGVSEAEAMARVAREEGVEPEHVLLEGSSLNTFENARFTAALLRAKGLERTLLVTSPSHLRRSLAVFRRAGVDVQGYRDPEAAEGVYAAAREVVALGLYRLLAFM